MATLSTHTLNSVEGTHAGQVGISLLHVAPDGARTTIFDKCSDSGGRLSERIDPALVDPAADY